MDIQRVIKKTASSLTRNRRFSFLIIALAPFLLILLLFTILTGNFLPAALEFVALLGTVFLVIFLSKNSLKLLKKVSDVEAAKLIDAETSGRERFLTLATSNSSEATNQYIESQAEPLLEKFNEAEALKWKPEPSALNSLKLSPIITIFILLALFFSQNTRLSPEQKELAKLQADEVRELIDDQLPSSLKNQLEDLAKTIEKEGLLSDDSLEELEDSIEQVEDLEQKSDQEIEQAFQTDQTEKEKQQKEKGKGKENSENQQKNQAAKQQEAQSESKPASDSPNKQNSSSGEKNPNSGSQQEKSEQNQKGSSSKQNQPSQKQDPSKNQDQGSSSAKEKKGEERNKGKGNKKKSETGVGEGKGKGKSGGQKEQQGETQSGQDNSGAKKGDAKNKSKGENSEQNNAGSKKANQQESANSSKPQANKNPNSAKEQTGGGPKQKREKLESVKDKLKDIKDKAKQGQKQKGQKQEGQKQEGQKQGDAKQGGTQQKGDKQQEQSKPSPSNNSGGQKKQSPQESGQGEKGKEAMQGKKPESTEKKNPETNKKSGSNDSNKNQGQAAKGKQSKSDAGHSKGEGLEKSPGKVAKPSKKAERYGPFGGGEDGPSLEQAKKETVNISNQGKIFKGKLGSSDGKKYKNRPGAKARVKIDNTDFKKPTPASASERQPIPVEYEDLF